MEVGAVADWGLPVGLPTVDCLSSYERDNYSFVRLIKSLAGDKGVGAELELDVSNEICNRLGKTTGGAFAPTRLRAGLDTKTNAAGAFTVQTETRDLIELLRAKTRVIQLGATVLSGLSSNVGFPVQLTASSGSAASFSHNLQWTLKNLSAKTWPVLTLSHWIAQLSAAPVVRTSRSD